MAWASWSVASRRQARGERIELLAGDEELVQFLPRQRHNPDDLVGAQRDKFLGFQPPQGFSQRRDRQPKVSREPFLVDRRTGRERAREDPLPELLIGRFSFSQDADSMQLGLGRLGHSLSHRPEPPPGRILGDPGAYSTWRSSAAATATVSAS